MLAVFGMLFALLLTWTTPAYAAEIQVGPGEQYEDLDTAIAAAVDGDVIVLHGDATTTGMNLSKNLTIKAADGLEARPKVTFTDKGIALWGISLTFQGCDVQMDGIGSTPYGEWGWMAICASPNASLTLDNTKMEMDGADASGNPHDIYFCNNNVLNIVNGSNLTIENYPQDALEWDGGNGGYNVNITDSTFVSDHNRSGFTGTFVATITNSTVNVVNSTGNGSNGSHFDIDDSTVNFNNNGSHGLSAGWLHINNSTVNTKDNHGMGITVNEEFEVTNKSIVTVSGNADNSSYGYAAVRLYNDYQFTVDGTSELYIKDNNNTGLYVRQGNLNVEDGARLEITGNTVSHTLLDGYGGGVYVGYGDNYDPTVKLPANAKICNNHSLIGGDDIYVSEGVNGPSLTFGPTGSGWVLDGAPDCTDPITGWYDDSEGARWAAHSADYSGIHVVEQEVNGTVTLNGLHALKAAHGLGSVAVDPADITVYMGGDQGYEGVITDEDNGSYDASNSLPEPGFYFVLPEEINQAFATAGITTDGGAADLSQYMRIYTHGYDGGELNWKLEMYGATQSNGVNRQFIYRIVPDPTPGQEPVPVRLQFTSEDGSTTFTNDTFNPAQAGALHQRYTMRLYTELVDANQVVFEVEIDGTKYYNTMELQEGVLDVRYVTGDQDDVVTDVVNSEEELAAARVDNPDKAYAVMPDGTTYYINESQVDVTDSAAPSLLFDDLAGSDDTGVAADHPQQLANRALDVITETGASFEHPWYQAKYLDLVDANNGNVYLTTDQPVTVYWPYPAGTDQNTEFHLVHFADLDRDMNNGEISGQIDSSSANYVAVENTEHGIRFTTDGFSPFVLMWEGEGDGPAEPPVNAEPPASGTLTATGDNSLTAITVLGAAGGTCIAAAYVLRKRKAQ